jgi:iron complex transport system substrate-binding protein
MAWRIETSLASSPTPQVVEGRFQAGLRTREAWHSTFPRSRAVVLLGMPLSLTVAGAVEALHLFPERLAACRYHNRMRWAAVVFALYTVGAYAQTTVMDDYGNQVRLATPASRIVSLAPHLTELLYAAGAGARVVGAVDYSDFPPEARSLPRVGSDAHINLESVLALRPDLIVAWPNPGSVRAINRLAELPLPVFRSEPRELEDIATALERLGVLAGTSGEAQRAARAFRARKTELEKRYAARAKVRVFYQVWDRPLLTVNGDHVISKVIRLCGGENVFAAAPVIAPEVDREAVLRANPEVIITSAAGAKRPAWVAAKHFYVVPAELIQRHTPRLLDGAEHVCRALEQARATRS